MCLSIPGKIIAVSGKFASVDYENQGIRENINNTLVKGNVGDFVLVQGGFAIKILTQSEAQEVIDTLKMIEAEFGPVEGARRG
jgi:hydrogenase assembly chaperone HypC/HupF